MSRYECHLSEELFEKAVTELNEPRDNAERLKAIDQLKASYNSEKFGPLIQEDDAFLLKFLRAKKFNQNKALNTLQNYHKIKFEMKEVFDKVHSPSVLQPIVDKSIIVKLGGNAKDGAGVFLYRPGLLRDMDLYALIAYSVLAMEKLLDDEQYQICGVCTIEDMHDFNISLLLNISPFTLAKMSSIWQDAMPLRFKAVHLINEGKVYDIMLTLMRPFVKKKLLERVHPHGSKYSEIHEYVDSSILPSYLEGTGPTPEEASRIWNEKITEDWPKDTAL